jgi:hypothetical protein
MSDVSNHPSLRHLSTKWIDSAGGDIGDLPPQMEVVEIRTRSYGLTFDNYNPTAYPNFRRMIFEQPRNTPGSAYDTLLSTCAQNAEYLNAQPGGFYLYIETATGQAAEGWRANQTDVDLLNSYANINVTLSYDQKPM